MRGVAVKHERPVGQAVERRRVKAMRTRVLVDTLEVQLRVDGVRSGRTRMQLPPEREEAVVVLPPAQRARTVTGRQRGGFVEEEQLGELARLQERMAVPSTEAQPARDPALAVEAAADLPICVVQAAPVAVDETARGIGDELAEGRDAVPERHRAHPSGSFFEAVPEGGDAYLLKAIVHDWEDEEAVEILRACRRAIRSDGMLLVVERVLDPPNEGAEAKFSDLNMLVGPGGRERTLTELEQLLEDAGLCLSDETPTPSGFSVIAAVPA